MLKSKPKWNKTTPWALDHIIYTWQTHPVPASKSWEFLWLQQPVGVNRIIDENTSAADPEWTDSGYYCSLGQSKAQLRTVQTMPWFIPLEQLSWQLLWTHTLLWIVLPTMAVHSSITRSIPLFCAIPQQCLNDRGISLLILPLIPLILPANSIDCSQ